MKKRNITVPAFIITWIIIYIGGLLLAFALSYMVTYYSNGPHVAIGQKDCSYYVQHHEFDTAVIRNSANNFAYSPDGNCLGKSVTGDFDTLTHFDQSCQKYFPEILKNGSCYHLLISRHLNSKCAVLVGLKMDDGNIFFFAKETTTLQSVMTVAISSITVTVLLAALFTGLILRHNKANEKMQREYVDNISHELKSPITSVRALLETLYDDMVKDPDKQKRYYGIMLNEINGLERTVSSMLELSRIQNGKTDCAKNVVVPANVFQDVMEKYRTLCDDMDVSFACEPDLSTWPVLYTNQSLVHRMLDILLDNAVKFAGVEGYISVSAKTASSQLTIYVKNSGTCIAPEDQAHIFDRFYKGDKAHHEKGSGLGLAIASEIAQCLNEKLWLVSSQSNETVFAFTVSRR